MSPVSDPGGDHIGRQHEQGLADPVPAVDPAVTPVEAKLGILTGQDLRLRSPEPVGRLQAVHRVGRSQFPRLHYEGEQSGGGDQKDEGIVQPPGEARGHR